MTGRVLPETLRRGLGKAAVLAGLSLALGACGMSQITAPFSSGGVFGSSKPENGWAATVTEANMLTAARDGSGSSDVTGATGGECPAVAVATASDGVITMKAPGGTGDNLAVLHRGEITRTARECAAGPGGVIVKYGVAGRVLLGPQGKAGNITLPVKVTIVDGARKTVKTEQIKLPVTIGASEAAGYFSVVREIVVPVAPGIAPQSYKVFVAFDRSVPGAS